MSACQYAATRATPGLITAAPLAADKNKVEVKTYAADEAAGPPPAPVAEDAPFHLLVAC